MACATLPMPIKSPLAKSCTKTLESFGDVVVFPNERLSRLDDFVRLRIAAQHVTFVAYLEREGISPSYYAAMWARFDQARRTNALLNEAFLARFAVAVRAR